LFIWDAFVHLIELALDRTAILVGSGGLAIILLTILLRTLMLPFTIRAVRSQAALAEMQPKLRELQKKYGHDRQRYSAEVMKLYQEHNVSPTAGCLPMLLQIPIFFALYFAIRNLSTSGSGVWSHGFLWLPNLASPDPLKILPILAGVFQFIQARMSRPAGQGKVQDPQQQMMYTMMLFMPLMVVAFGWNFASGPVIYWVVSAIYAVVQQWLITGWGGMLDWFPFLPDLPEHRRLGYVDPAKRNQQQARQGSGGLMGLINKQVEKQIRRVEEQRGVAPSTNQQGQASAATTARGEAERSEPTPSAPLDPAALVPRRSRPVKQKPSSTPSKQ